MGKTKKHKERGDKGESPCEHAVCTCVCLCVCVCLSVTCGVFECELFIKRCVCLCVCFGVRLGGKGEETEGVRGRQEGRKCVVQVHKCWVFVFDGGYESLCFVVCVYVCV